MVGPDSQGQLPSAGLDGVITTRGQFVIVVRRVSIIDPSNLAPLHQIQAGLTLTPLSSYLGTRAPPEPPPIDFPEWGDEHAAGTGVLTYINAALAWHPPAWGRDAGDG